MKQTLIEPGRYDIWVQTQRLVPAGHRVATIQRWDVRRFKHEGVGCEKVQWRAERMHDEPKTVYGRTFREVKDAINAVTFSDYMAIRNKELIR